MKIKKTGDEIGFFSLKLCWIENGQTKPGLNSSYIPWVTTLKRIFVHFQSNIFFGAIEDQEIHHF